MKKKYRLNLNNIFIIFSYFAIFISIFTNYYHYDEALVNDGIIGYSKIKSFVMINNHNLESPFNKFFSYLIYILNPDPLKPENYFYNRIINLIFIVIGFIYLLKILNKFFISNKKFFYLSYGLYIYWFCFHSGGMTSRFDSILASLIIIYIYYYLISLHFYKKTGFYFTYLLNFILLSCHPFFLYPLLISAIYILKINWNKKYIFIILTIVGLIFFFPLLIFDKINLVNIHKYYLNFIYFLNSHLENNYNAKFDFFFLIKNIIKDLLFLTSASRFGHLHYYSMASYLVLVSLVIINIFFYFIETSKNHKIINSIGIYFLIVLFISPNKWAHHLSILVVIYSIIISSWASFFIKHFDNNFRLKKYFCFIKKINFNLLSIIFLFLFITFNFISFSRHNYNLYLTIKENFPKIAKLEFFSKSKSIEENLSNISVSLRNKKYYSYPNLIHMFPESKYIGYSGEFLNNEKIDFIIIETAKGNVETKDYKFIPKFRGENFEKLLYSFEINAFYYHIFIK